MQRNSGGPTHSGTSLKTRPLIFYPFTVLLLSLGGALLYAVWVNWCFDGQIFSINTFT
jgi:hypothetical protein